MPRAAVRWLLVTSAAVADATPSPLVVRTVAVDDPGDLVALLPPDEPLAWIRRGEGLVAWGETARLEVDDPDRFELAENWWAALTGSAVVRDEVGVPGTGLVAMASIAFAGGSSVLVVPEVLVGHRVRAGRSVWWVTTVSVGNMPAAPVLSRQPKPSAPVGLRYADGAMSGAQWGGQVSEAVRRIATSELEKVVLARDLTANADEPVDVRWPLRRLAALYPSCWTYSVQGLVGATPELLVRRERGLVTSRVLAGTIRRTGDDEHDLALAAALARSSKDLEEHEYAVRSVADALASYCTSVNVPEAPFVLHLPNVMHLATDVAGVMDDDTSVLGLAAALHPTAAVGGTPTGSALAAIAELEQMDRGRYAGPVGWVDAHGDGELGIALRCAQIDGSRLRLFAGCGIVAGSDPVAELAEAQAKLVPVRDALGC